MVCGATCEWKASECGAQWCAAQHANGKRQSAAHNGVRRGMRMESVRVRRTTEHGAACEWKALVRIAQRSAAHNGVRRNMRMESVRVRRTMVCGEASEWQASECGAQRSAARHANGKRHNAAQTECSAACEWKASERGGQRGAAQHANEKRQSAAHNGARRSMRMESASARCTTERNAVTAQSQRSENYARKCIPAGACVPRPSAALEDAGWRARTGAALR